MELIIWNSLIVLTKGVFYLCLAVQLGWLFCLSQYGRYLFPEPSREQRYLYWLRTSSVLLLLSSGGWFLVNTAAMAEQGISGLYDPLMLSIMFDSSIGSATLWRIVAGSGLLCCHFLRDAQRGASAFVISLAAMCLAGLFYSFTLTGHLAERELILRLLLVLHLLLISWWFGLLVNLRWLCRGDMTLLAQGMMKFGHQAMWLVPIVLIVGGVLSYQLIGSFSVLFTSEYGALLMLKLLIVAIVLVLAARHKLSLVAKVATQGGTAVLARSISIEMLCAALVLLSSAALTSLAGPPS